MFFLLRMPLRGGDDTARGDSAAGGPLADFDGYGEGGGASGAIDDWGGFAAARSKERVLLGGERLLRRDVDMLGNDLNTGRTPLQPGRVHGLIGVVDREVAVLGE